MKLLNHSFQNCELLKNWLNRYQKKSQPKVAGDVIFGENIKTIEGYALFIYEAAIVISFRENQYQPFALLHSLCRRR